MGTWFDQTQEYARPAPVRILSKLGVRDRTRAVLKALEQGLV